MERIVAYDPGGTTGIAFSDLGGKVYTCAVGTPKEVWSFITPDVDVVVYERFATSGLMSHDGLYTVELVGGIQALCAHLHIPCVRHEPQNRIAYLEEAKHMVEQTRKLMNNQKGRGFPHECDALAHLLCHRAEGMKIVTRKWGTGISNA